jgi:O-antigen/teichoic acid export membrane protein
MSPEPADLGAPAGTAGRIAWNAALKMAVQATRLLSLVFLVLAARVLGPETFGRFTFAYALATLLGAALDLGMHSLLVRGMARAPEMTADHWRAAVTLKLALLAPAGLALAAFPLATGRPLETTGAVWLLGAAIALQSFTEIAVSTFTAFGRVELELGLRLVEKACLVGVGLAGLALGGGLWLVSGAFALAAAVSVALGAGLVHRRLAPLRWRPSRALARSLWTALGPVAAAFVLAFATTRLVPLLVALLGGDEAAGYFGAAVRILDVTVVAPVAVVGAVYPVLARLGPGDVRFRRILVRAADVLLVLGLGVALSLAHGAEPLTRWVYGSRYGPAAPLLPVLGGVACVSFLNQYLAMVFLALDRPGRLVGVGAVGFAASAALTPGLVLLAGAAGGALALALAETVLLAGSLVALLPFVGLPFGRGALRAAAAALVAGLAASLLPAGVGRLAGVLVTYGGAVLLFEPVPRALWRDVARGRMQAAVEGR